MGVAFIWGKRVRRGFLAVWPLAIITAVPLVLILLVDSWTFSTIGWLDAWSYVGYAHHYSDPGWQSGYYKVSRVPWILYEAAFRNLFEPRLASHLIQLTCLVSAGVSVFVTCRLLKLRDLAGFLASLFLVTYGWFMGDGSGGADYHNTFAAPLYGLTFLATTFAALSPNVRWPLWTAGCVYALVVHSSIFYLNFLPVLVFHFAALRRKDESLGQAIKPYVVALIASGMGVTIALCIINKAVGRPFWFFKPILRALWTFTTDNTSIAIWWKPWASGWIFAADARYMALLFAGAVLAAIALYYERFLHLKKEDSASDASARLLFWEYLFLFALWVFWQSVGKTALDYSWFAHLLIIPVVFVIAALMSLARLPKLTAPAAIVVAVVFVGSLLGGADIQGRLPGYVMANAMAVSVLLVLLAAGSLFLVRRYRAALLVPLCLLALAKDVSNWHALDFRPFSGIHADEAFLTVMDVHRMLTANRKGDQIYVWFDDQTPEFYMSDKDYPRDRRTRSFATSLVSTGLQYLDIPWNGMSDVEKLPEANLRQAMQKNAYIALITEHRDKVERLLERLNEMGISAKLEGPVMVTRGPFQVSIYCLKPS